MRLVPVIALVALGCGPAAPEEPTWITDVRPILAANCIRCHGSPARHGAPTTFRLDVLDDVGPVKGARSMAEFIAARTAGRGDMPPVGPSLSARQKAILEEWKFTTAAEMRPDNRPAEAAVTISDGGNDTAIVDLVVSDPDGDLVHGQLKSDATPVATLRNGRQRIVVDTSGLPAGARALTAILDDGSRAESVDLGTLTVVHDNATPRVDILEPALDALLVAGETGKVVFRATDADAGEQLTVALDAVAGELRVPIAAGVVPEASGLGEVPFAAGSLPEGAGWRIEARVTDGKSTRTVTSEPFIVSHAVATEGYAQIRPVVNDLCRRCHSAHLPTGPNFDLLPALQEVRGRAWRKLELGHMPPKSVSVVFPDLRVTEADRARLSAWFYAGAPP